MDEAISRGTIVMNLLSDAAQSETWPAIKPQLTKGKVGLPHIKFKLDSKLMLFKIDPLLLSRVFSSLQRSY